MKVKSERLWNQSEGAPTGQGVTIDHQNNNEVNELKHWKNVMYVNIYEFIMILKRK